MGADVSFTRSRIRMRHRFHSICPYFAMFPETFVEKHLAASPFSGVVFDPFCGRGTTVFQALLHNRVSAGCDVHPVAACVAGAKCNPPTPNAILTRINQLEASAIDVAPEEMSEDMQRFFCLCFHEETLAQLRFLRRTLAWKSDDIDRFIAALCLGALHGESHRSECYFSNRMPRTISTKPGYSVRWWTERGYVPPYRNVFEILRYLVGYRFRTSPPKKRAEIALIDARIAGEHFANLACKVSDVITSPPYLDTTNYKEDQWLRLWFLGAKAKSTYSREDGRHYNLQMYMRFLEEAWAGVAPLLAKKARIVIRIGGRQLSKAEALECLSATLARGLDRKIVVIDEGITSNIEATQANTFRGSKASPTVEHDFCFLVR